MVARERQFREELENFRVDANRPQWNTLSLLSLLSAVQWHAAKLMVSRRKKKRKRMRRRRKRTEEDVCMPKLWVDSPARRVLVPVQLLLMMSLHFVSGSLGRCLRVV